MHSLRNLSFLEGKSHTVGEEGGGGRPVREDSKHANFIGEHVEKRVIVAVDQVKTLKSLPVPPVKT